MVKMHKNDVFALLFLLFVPILKKVEKNPKKLLTNLDIWGIIDKLTARAEALDH